MGTTANIPNMIRTVLRHPLETVICGLLIAMTAVVFSQVIARYVLQAPLSWSEELARFLLMWLSMMSAAYAFKTKSHFALQLLVSQFSDDLQRWVALLVHMIVGCFFAVLLYFSVIFVIGVDGHIAPALQISMQIPYASIVVGSALMMYQALRSAWMTIVRQTIDVEN